MQLENNLNTTITNAPHPHYKRVIIAIALFFVVALMIVFGYQYFLSKKRAIQTENALWVQYQEQQANQSAAFLTLIDNKAKPATDADNKEIESMIKATPSQPSGDSADVNIMIESQQKQAEQLFQEWKATQ